MADPYRPFEGDDWIGRDLRLGRESYQVETRYNTAVGQSAFASKGRKAYVYKLKKGDEFFALKVFTKKYAGLNNLFSTMNLSRYASLSGLQACKRKVLLGGSDARLWRAFADALDISALHEPGLSYGVVMPWIQGRAWGEIIHSREALSERQSAILARAAAEVLRQVEARGLAHADIASLNVFVALTRSSASIELVDVEDMFHPSFFQPHEVPAGTPGYDHPASKREGYWNAYGDRFAGAVLLAEMLCWHDAELRAQSEELSYFHPDEMGRSAGRRYRSLLAVLQSYSGEVATLFQRAWQSSSLAECPTLLDWHHALGTGPSRGLADNSSLLTAFLRPRYTPPSTNIERLQTQFVSRVLCSECSRRVRPGVPIDHLPTCSKRADTPGTTPQTPGALADLLGPDWLSKPSPTLRSFLSRNSHLFLQKCDECGNYLDKDSAGHADSCSKNLAGNTLGLIPPNYRLTSSSSTGPKPSLFGALICAECSSWLANGGEHQPTCSKYLKPAPPVPPLITAKHGLLSKFSFCDECHLLLSDGQGHDPTCSKSVPQQRSPIPRLTRQHVGPSPLACDECGSTGTDLLGRTIILHKVGCSKRIPRPGGSSPSRFSDVTFTPLDDDE